MKNLSTRDRAQLLEIIDAEAKRLEATALDPETTSAEEQILRPKPEFDSR